MTFRYIFITDVQEYLSYLDHLEFWRSVIFFFMKIITNQLLFSALFILSAITHSAVLITMLWLKNVEVFKVFKKYLSLFQCKMGPLLKKKRGLRTRPGNSLLLVFRASIYLLQFYWCSLYTSLTINYARDYVLTSALCLGASFEFSFNSQTALKLSCVQFHAFDSERKEGEGKQVRE